MCFPHSVRARGMCFPEHSLFLCYMLSWTQLFPALSPGPWYVLPWIQSVPVLHISCTHSGPVVCSCATYFMHSVRARSMCFPYIVCARATCFSNTYKHTGNRHRHHTHWQHTLATHTGNTHRQHTPAPRQQTQASHTQASHTQATHTQVTHTQATYTQATNTQESPENLINWWIDHILIDNHLMGWSYFDDYLMVSLMKSLIPSRIPSLMITWWFDHITDQLIWSQDLIEGPLHGLSY